MSNVPQQPVVLGGILSSGQRVDPATGKPIIQGPSPGPNNAQNIADMEARQRAEAEAIRQRDEYERLQIQQAEIARLYATDPAAAVKRAGEIAATEIARMEEANRKAARTGGLVAPPYSQQEIANARSASSPENIQSNLQGAATQQQFFTNQSWLNPAFQMQAAQLGQSSGSQVYSDPLAQQAQWNAMRGMENQANTPLNFMGSGAQQGIANQFAGVAAGQGAPQFMGGAQQQSMMDRLLGVQMPSYMSGDQQQQALDTLRGVSAPNFMGGADQRAVYEQAMGMAGNTGPGSLQFDDGSRQQEQYGNLQEIIAGGGATAIEMANRAKARADSEAWLRGQREADMADYAERGLTGSGMELLNLSADRQSAAGRNSMSDLQTAAQLEERRLGAINSAAGLGSTMRGQTIGEQGLLNERTMTGLGIAGNTSNAMRNADIQEQTFLNESARAQAAQAAAIAGQMRGQTAQENQFTTGAQMDQAFQASQIAQQMRQMGYQEGTYLDTRMINALQSQADIYGQMRTQQANEQIGQGTLQQNAYSQMGNMATDLRNASFSEGESRAKAADLFAQLNQSAVNTARAGNAQFLQNSYQNYINNSQTWDVEQLRLRSQAALGNQSNDTANTIAGFDFGTRVGMSDASTANHAYDQWRNTVLGGAGNAATMQYNADLITPSLAGLGPGISAIIGGAVDYATPNGSTSPQSGNSPNTSGGTGTVGNGGLPPLSSPGGTWANPYDPNKWEY